MDLKDIDTAAALGHPSAVDASRRIAAIDQRLPAVGQPDASAERPTLYDEALRDYMQMLFDYGFSDCNPRRVPFK